MKIGDQVRFLGCTPEQVRWGNNDDPQLKLIEGNTYLVEEVEIHSQHTKITLIGVDGKFNSVCFEKAVGCIRQAKPSDYSKSYDKIPDRY
jgi:hypothetical protein|tara:strand:- start:2439 stop:2708 length:270 start_codon:yes stop_codon:yes gene_type:complete